jgi:acetyl esterase/lipase
VKEKTFMSLDPQTQAYLAQQEAGVPVIVRRYDGLTHGFLNTASVIDKARDAIVESAQTLREAFATN